MGSGNVWELDKSQLAYPFPMWYMATVSCHAFIVNIRYFNSSDVFEKENRAPVSAQQLKPCVNSPAAPKASLSNQQSEWSFSEEVQKFETNSHAWAAETRHKGLSIGRESAVAKVV
ncbi:hypothetical protein SARC_14321 [Sphaeroforma arctica JP610]|uniref:Uncharacterized protein n=1 Tax=Sphaeroforma arctica JP610 TaxID=667725 RepID=A0A0L0F9B8_9EUKA|nr:hypothetical protein SARC_14321 [Sphaeroforma arctica JP610]KNC73121.1 hypothetical protein SARC_14321 [Sphaeroforma arctica JP610]|eukprot:XP_014147023.1 hypothetical protein SARC_14321 [Sphaeroforma arctica JP610]